MTFLAEPFPDCVSFGAIGGPGFQTDVVIYGSGNESRSDNWSQARGQWEVAHNATLPANYNPLIAHFRNAKGKARAFPFKDWTDFSTVGGTGIFTAVVAGSPATTVYQLTKRYTTGSATIDRFIYLPKNGTIIVSGGTGVSISYTTGIVTVASGTPTAWTGEFYVPARYDIDEMRGEIVDRQAHGANLIMNWGSIPIVETRDYL